MRVFGEGEPAGIISAQRFTVPRRHGQPAFGIENKK